MSQHDHAYRVPPLSIKKIEVQALEIRKALQVKEAFFPLIEVVEFALPRLFPEFVLDIKTSAEMTSLYGSGTLAMTTPANMTLELSEDTYEGLHTHNGRSRYTVAHELGHLFLHQNTGGFARFDSQGQMRIYESSEWQADNFAIELLAPLELAAACASIEAVAILFGISRRAAEIRWKEIEKYRTQKKETLSANSGILR
jgi:Zn-dependent peptidase ImmA (M78 family)